jgi:two-component sensor histidine kinase
VVREIVTRGLFYWLRAPRNYADIRADERILGILRLLLGFCYLGALVRPGSIDESGAFEALAIIYLTYGLLILLLLRYRPFLSPYTHIAIHVMDIIWAAQLATLIHWPTMAIVLFFFIIASSAFRWGFWEAHLTLASYFGFWALGCYLHHQDHLAQEFSQSTLTLVPDALLYIGLACTAGLIAEAKSVRSERQSISRMIENLRTESRVERAISAGCSEGRQLFGAMQVLVVAQDLDRNRATLYRSIRSQSEVQMRELGAAEQALYCFPDPGESMRLSIGHRPANLVHCHMLADGKVKPGTLRPDILSGFLSAHPFRLLLAGTLAFKNDWTVRVFIVDPMAHFGGFAGLRSLHYSMREVSPAIYDRYLVDHLKTRAKAVANGQVARELHDGVIQSLSSIHMQLEALRLQAGPIFAEGNDPLARMQQSVQQEISALRDFTQQLRALEIDSSRLLGYIAGMALKFESEHGITTLFVPEVDEVRAGTHVCSEVARIVQEALVNIRKHSRAREAKIHLCRQNDHYLLTIRDNGRGFSFSGRRSHEELQAGGHGPIVLMERVCAIGGSICIESTVGGGACLEITFPA